VPEWAQHLQLATLHLSDGLVRPDLQFSSFSDLQPVTRGDGRHEVYRAIHPDGSLRALKEFPLAQYDALLKEARVLCRLRHPFVLEAEAVVWNKEGHKAFVVLPFCAGGSLQELMDAGGLSSARVKIFARQVRVLSSAR
jgi:serine/threonine protein kinase